jgi:hypothetical protein
MRGGKRIGSGRPQGMSKQTIARNEIAAVKNTAHLPKAGKSKPALEVLQSLLDQALELVGHFEPKEGNARVDRGRHERFFTLAKDLAKELAKYQAPQLKAITVTPQPPPAETVRRFTLTVFDHNHRRVNATPPATLTPVALGNGFDDDPTPVHGNGDEQAGSSGWRVGALVVEPGLVQASVLSRFGNVQLVAGLQTHPVNTFVHARLIPKKNTEREEHQHR